MSSALLAEAAGLRPWTFTAVRLSRAILHLLRSDSPTLHPSLDDDSAHVFTNELIWLIGSSSASLVCRVTSSRQPTMPALSSSSSGWCSMPSAAVMRWPSSRTSSEGLESSAYFRPLPSFGSLKPSVNKRNKARFGLLASASASSSWSQICRVVQYRNSIPSSRISERSSTSVEVIGWSGNVVSSRSLHALTDREQA